jgi:hypothetical protein
MDDRAGAGIVDERDVLVDAVIGFHLEAPPVRPHRRADAVRLEKIGDLVALDGVVEGRDLVAELLGHIHDIGHFVGAVAVVLDGDLAGQHAAQRLHGEVAAGISPPSRSYLSHLREYSCARAQVCRISATLAMRLAGIWLRPP